MIKRIREKIRAKIRPGWLGWIGGAIVLTLAIVVNSAIVGSSQDTSVKTAAAGTPRPSQLPSGKGDLTTTTTTAPPAPVTPGSNSTEGGTFQQVGSGRATSGQFRVPANWDLGWTYNCSKVEGGTGTFVVTVYDADGSLEPDAAAVDERGRSGNGTQRYRAGGVKYLRVVSECDWGMTVAKGISLTEAGPTFQQVGSGPVTTAKFRVSQDWDLGWSYRCANVSGGTGRFVVTVYDADGSLVDDSAPVDERGREGRGTSRYHSGGVRYLRVASECDWGLTVPKGRAVTVGAPIFQQAGSGPVTTTKFKAPKDWNLGWSYRCFKVSGGVSEFVVRVYNADGSLDAENAAVSERGPGGRGTASYHVGGTKYLQVASACDWELTAVTG